MSVLQIAESVEQTIVSALLHPGATREEEEELRRKYRAGTCVCVCVFTSVFHNWIA